jgi:hypothetical protein
MFDLDLSKAVAQEDLTKAVAQEDASMAGQRFNPLCKGISKVTSQIHSIRWGAN